VPIRSTTLGKEQQQRSGLDPDQGKPNLNLSRKEEKKNKLDGFSEGSATSHESWELEVVYF
jgi:hypothetical protein